MIFITTGETSGDNLAAKLVQALWSQDPNLTIEGVCGPDLRAFGVFNHGNMEQFETLFPMTLLKFPILYWRFQKLCSRIKHLNPDICIFIDASFLNLNLAKRLRKLGYQGRIIKYTCPAQWWPDHGRRYKLISYFDDLICIFPGEAELFLDTPLKAHYFGSPHFIKAIHPKKTKKKILAFFPGSRIFELKLGFTKMLNACLEFQTQHPEFEIQIARASEQQEAWIRKRTNLEIIDSQKLLKTAYLALAKPGTNNLELAQHGVPTLVAFPLGPMARWLAQKLLKKRAYYSLANWLFRQEIFPELLIKQKFSISDAVSKLESLLNTHQRKLIIQQCKQLSARLSSTSHFQKVAHWVVNS